MKSIKEKSEEYSFIGQGINPDGIQFREFDTNKQDGFVAGANYVLEEIEKMLSRVNEYKDGSDHTILYLEIEFLVKQLKK